VTSTVPRAPPDSTGHLPRRPRYTGRPPPRTPTPRSPPSDRKPSSPGRGGRRRPRRRREEGDEHRGHRRLRTAGHHRLLRPRLRGHRTPGGVRGRRDRGQAPRGRAQAAAARGHTRGPLGAARLQRRGGARPARGRARLLLPRPAVEGLPRRGGRWCREHGEPRVAGGRAPRRLARATVGSEPAVPRQLILLRYGQTHYNAAFRMQGQLDTELSELGVQQALAAGRSLAPRRPWTIISSDLRRAHATARALATEVEL